MSVHLKTYGAKALELLDIVARGDRDEITNYDEVAGKILSVRTDCRVGDNTGKRRSTVVYANTGETAYVACGKAKRVASARGYAASDVIDARS